MNRKLKKADDLRMKAVAAEKESEKAMNAWCKTSTGTSEYEKARKASNRAEAKEDKTYKDYYDYVHKNFEKDKIDASFHKVCQDKNNSKKFMSKAFLNGLMK